MRDGGGGMKRRRLHRALMMLLTAAAVCIAVAWIVSFGWPASISYRMKTVPAEKGNFVERDLIFYSSQGGLMIDWERTVCRHPWGADGMQVEPTPPTQVIYPRFYKDPRAKGFVHDACGFWICVQHSGPAYMFNYNGPSPPTTQEMEADPEGHGGTQIWQSHDDDGVVVPHWFLLLLAALLPVVQVAKRLRNQRAEKRRAKGLCARCGYDLRATPERCPECGAIAKPVAANAEVE
jgi:hypothetical protein